MMRIGGVERGEGIAVHVDGASVACFRGETIATAMLAAGVVRFRSDRRGQPRGLYCNMGSCGECFVRADDRRVRACLTLVEHGMSIVTHD